MGNGVFCKTIGYCNQDQNIPKSDIYIIKSLDESQYQLNYLNYIIAKNANEKEFNNIIKKEIRNSLMDLDKFLLVTIHLQLTMVIYL